MLVSSSNSFNNKFVDLVNNNPSLKELKNSPSPKADLGKTEDKTNASISATFISDYQNSGNYIAFKISQKLNSPNERPSVSIQLNLSGYGIGGDA